MSKENIKEILKNMKLSQKESEIITGGQSGMGGVSGDHTLGAWVCFTNSCNPACNISSCSTCVVCATSACDTSCVPVNGWYMW